MRTLLIACAVMVSSLVVAAQNRTVTLVGTTPLTNSFLTMGTNGTQLRSTGIAVQNLTNLIGIGTINGVSSVFTNTVWVAKNGSDTTGALGQLGRPFLTLQAAITAASSGYTVFVMPGTYDEQITLKDGVNLWLSDGVTLTYSDSGNTPAILDNGASVTCVIDGYGKLLRTGSTGTSAHNLLTTGASTIVLRCQSLEVRGGSSSESIRQTGASTLTVYAKSITASGAGWSMNNASAIGTLWNCSVVATNDYGILKSSGNLTVNNSFVRSDANSAFQCAAGTSTELLTIKNSVGYSTALFGLEMSGGYCVAIDSTFESTRNVAVEGSAISKYGGELLVLDNVQLICTEESAFSIETQNITPHGEIQIRGQSYANRVIDPNPEINITIGSLIVQTNMHRTISDVAATGSATAFNLKSLNTLGTGDTLLSITNNATLAFRVDGASGYTGAGTKFLSDDGTYQTAGGGDSVWTNYLGRIMPVEGNTNNVLTFTSGLADNATNIAVQINSTNIWSHGTRLLSTGTGGTEYFYLTTDGGMHVGNDLFAPQPGQTIISERDTALGAADHNGIGLLMYTNGVLTAEWDSVGSSSAWSVSQKGGLGIGTGTHLESHTEADNAYFKLNYVASEVFDFDPFVSSSGSAVAYYMRSVNALTNGDSLFLLENTSGVEAFRVAGNSGYTGTGANFLSDDGTYKTAGGGDSVWTNYLGRIMPIDGNTNNVLTFTSGLADNATNVALIVNTTNLWSASGSLLAKFQNAGTNHNVVYNNGSVLIGPNAIGAYSWMADTGPIIGTYVNTTAEPSVGTSGFMFEANDEVPGPSTDNYIYGFVYPSTGTEFIIGADPNTWRIDLEPNTPSENTQLAYNDIMVFKPARQSTGSAVAYLFDTSNTLTNGDKSVSIKNAGTSQLFITPQGGIVSGPNAETINGGSFNNTKKLIFYNDVNAGDAATQNFDFYVVGNAADQTNFANIAFFNTVADLTNSWSSFALSAQIGDGLTNKAGWDFQAGAGNSTYRGSAFNDFGFVSDNTYYLLFAPRTNASGSAVAYKLASVENLGSGDSLLSLYDQTNIRFKVDAESGYTGAGTLFLSDNGTYQTVSAGTTINPTDGYLPYRQNSTTFGDSPWYRISTNALGFNGTGRNWFVQTSSIGVGTNALNNFTSGSGVTALGYMAGLTNNGFFNVFLGDESGKLVTGDANTYIGSGAGKSATTTDSNVGIGYNALTSSTGDFNVGIGAQAMLQTTTAGRNVAVGYAALQGFSTTGYDNVAIGYNALLGQAGISGTVSNSVAIGSEALYYNSQGSNNVAIGYRAAWENTNSAFVTVIGALSHSGTTALTNIIGIGYNVQLTNNNEIVIGNSANTKAIFPITSYTGAGTKFLSDDGTYKTVVSGATQYDQLIHPHRADQVGAVILTSDPSSVNYGHALFSGTAATNANFIEYRWQVPKNINTSVDLEASWSVMLNAADTDASTYTIGMASVAASSSYSAPTLGNYVTLTIAADASGAQNDYETVQDVTLTGWAAALTAGQVFVIRVARDGAGDTSNVAHYDAGLTIKYGVQ